MKPDSDREVVVFSKIISLTASKGRDYFCLWGRKIDEQGSVKVPRAHPPIPSPQSHDHPSTRTTWNAAHWCNCGVLRNCSQAAYI